jgi:hypothetical protein
MSLRAAALDRSSQAAYVSGSTPMSSVATVPGLAAARARSWLGTVCAMRRSASLVVEGSGDLTRHQRSDEFDDPGREKTPKPRGRT